MKSAAWAGGWFAATLIASAQEPVVTSFGNNGWLGWNAPAGSACTVEWAPAAGTLVVHLDESAGHPGDRRGRFRAGASTACLPEPSPTG